MCVEGILMGDGRKERRETRIENGKKAKKQSISQELYLNLT